MMSSSQSIPSVASQPLPVDKVENSGNCCCTQLLANKYLQLTLLVGGILGIVLGYYYLQNVARIATMTGGSIFIALSLIGKCSSPATTGQQKPPPQTNTIKSSAPLNFPSAVPTQAAQDSPVHQSQPKRAPKPKYKETLPPEVIAAAKGAQIYRLKKIPESMLRKDKVGSALLSAIDKQQVGVKDATYTHNFDGGETVSTIQGYRIYFSDTSQVGAAPFSVILKPEVYSVTPDVIFWAIVPLADGTGQETARLQTALKAASHDGEMRESMFADMIEGKIPRFQFLEVPESVALFF